LVEKSASERENVRDIYLGFTYKGKLVIREDNNGEKTLVIVHKIAEVSSAKILNSSGEENVME